jgi:ferric-dicitrate binding protein FerR (iron transport regulator)
VDPHIPPPDAAAAEQLERYYAGTCSPAERAEIEAQIARSSVERLFRDDLVAAVRASAPPLSAQERATALARLETRLADTPAAPSAAITIPAPMRRVALYAAVGAVLALAVGLNWHVRRSGGLAARADATAVSRDYHTRAGQRAIVTLADGSRLTLGPATSVRVAIVPDGNVNVTVDGEAFFSVVHDARRPFLVQAGNARTVVLGTEFSVRHYDTDSFARVVVVGGRVGLEAATSSEPRANRRAILAASTLGIVSDSGDVRVTENVPVDRYTGWTRGDLNFENRPVREILVDLGRAYGVEIRLSDSTLAKRSLTWSVETARYPLAQVLHEIAELLDAHIVTSGNVVTLAPGRHAARRTLDATSPLTLQSQYGR